MKVNGTTVSATQEYTFRGEETGEYALSFTASNEDGTDSVAFTVRVCTEEQMAFDWRFEQTAYNVSVGRTVFIRPYYTENAFDAVYTWKVNGEPVEAPAVETVYAGPAPACILAFTPTVRRDIRGRGRHDEQLCGTHAALHRPLLSCGRHLSQNAFGGQCGPMEQSV